jgi:DNA-directed RNA polymerase subunit L
LNERYEDNLSTHLDLDLDLSLEAGSSGGPDRNRVYELLNTTTENLQTTRSVSIVGCSQSIPSTQTPEFTMMLDQRVKARTTHLNEKFERLVDDYEELRRLVLEMRSQMDGTCAPHNWRHGPDYD